MPRDARRPPASMTGRQPKRFTHTLQSGPGVTAAVWRRLASPRPLGQMPPLPTPPCGHSQTSPGSAISACRRVAPCCALGRHGQAPDRPRGWRPLTCPVQHGQQDGGDPGRVAVADPKLTHELLEEDADRLGEGVGEAGDDKAAQEDGPAPAPVGGFDTCWALVDHGPSHGQEGWVLVPEKEAGRLTWLSGGHPGHSPAAWGKTHLSAGTWRLAPSLQASAPSRNSALGAPNAPEPASGSHLCHLCLGTAGGCGVTSCCNPSGPSFLCPARWLPQSWL